MPRSPAFAGVILAAGESSRMGRDKALLPWPKESAKDTFLSAAIRSLDPFSDFVIIVAGANTPALAPVAYASGASIVTNPDPSRGQFSSLQIGLYEVLNHGRDAAIITLVDRPPVRVETIRQVHAAFIGSSPAIWAVVPEHSGRHGHPFFAGREMIEAFLRAPVTATAREAEHANRDHIKYLPVDDPFAALNVNTPEDYAALIEHPPRVM